MTSTDPRAWLVERQALADAATDGPWVADEGWVTEPRDRYVVVECSDPDRQDVQNARFIADARQSVPAMAAALTAVLDQHRKSPVLGSCEGGDDCAMPDSEHWEDQSSYGEVLHRDDVIQWTCAECAELAREHPDGELPEYPCDTRRAVEAALGGEG